MISFKEAKVKKPCFIAVGTFLAIIVMSGLVMAQVPTQQQTKLKKPLEPLIPDLVLQNLTVNQNAMQSVGSYFQLPFQVTVKNIGTGLVNKPFYVAFQYFHSVQSNWQGGQDKDNCFKVTQQLQPNQSFVLNGHFKIFNAMLSDQDLRIRTFADFCCLEEFPPQNGLIGEMNENNNASNEVTIHGGYLPYLASIKPAIATKAVDEVTLSGTSFGTQAGNHTVVIQHGNNKVSATINSWHAGVITFIVPASVENGNKQVYIGDKNSLQQLSNKLTFKVAQQKELAWDTLLTAWDIFKGALSIRLHTWSGSYSYANVSAITFANYKMPIDVPLVQIDIWAGHYRFLVNDLNSQKDTIILSKMGCNANQLRLDVAFESAGTELIGYYMVNGPAGQWRRTGAPDIEVNDAKMSIVFTFIPSGGSINYDVSTNFSASVNASGKNWDRIMDSFISGWDNDVKQRVNQGVHDGLLKTETRQNIIGSLMQIIRTLMLIGQNRTIAQISFTNSGIRVIFY
jgi:hypothetical protein